MRITQRTIAVTDEQVAGEKRARGIRMNVPPDRVKGELDRQARLLRILEDRREDWLPFPPGGLLWVSALVFAQLALTVGAATAAVYWFGANSNWAVYVIIIVLVVNGIMAYAPFTKSILSSGGRAYALDEALAYAYAAWDRRNGPARYLVLYLMSVNTLHVRGILAKWHGTLREHPHQRLQHAARWARVSELEALSILLGQTTLAFLGLDMLLWRFGLIHSSRHFTWAQATLGSASDLLWTLLHAIPALEVTDTIHWNRPASFANDVPQSVLLLLFKLGVIVPILAYLVGIVRNRRQFDPETLLMGRSPMTAVAHELATGKPEMPSTQEAWADVFRRAATRLKTSGVRCPYGRPWSDRKVYEALTLEGGPNAGAPS